MRSIGAAFVLSLTLLAGSAAAYDDTWNYSVQVSAEIDAAKPAITLLWPQDTSGVPRRYTVYRKAPSATSWGQGVQIAGSATRYTDSDIRVGEAYEYRIVKDGKSNTGYGYILAGIEVPLVESRGKLILLVDRTHAHSLAAELARLEEDLMGDGWTVLRHDVNPAASVTAVKALIREEFLRDPKEVKAVFLFGRIAVPYSGKMSPDGHPDHVGAWPADVYYADLDGTWTDTTISYQQKLNADAQDAVRLSNFPGDGKFDQIIIPGQVGLQLGRVDLANMPGRINGTTPSFPSERELLRQYLNKNHNFRQRKFDVHRRALVGDYFGLRGGEAFSASGYRSFAPLVGADNISNLNTAHNNAKGLWIPTLASNDYLLAYGCGPGTYRTVDGLGNTGEFRDGHTVELVDGDIRAVFTLIFGSWLGDWDHEDNFLRSVLATPTHGLAAAWSGRPHWFVHALGLGETIGYTTQLTQNNRGLYQNQINSSANMVHIALMGDPTLRLHPVAPIGAITGTPTPKGTLLRWEPSRDAIVGYHVYRADQAGGKFARITDVPVADTRFLDSRNAAGDPATRYMVRAVKLETTPSGSYYNASQGVFWPELIRPAFPDVARDTRTVDTDAPESGS